VIAVSDPFGHEGEEHVIRCW